MNLFTYIKYIASLYKYMSIHEYIHTYTRICVCVFTHTHTIKFYTHKLVHELNIMFELDSFNNQV